MLYGTVGWINDAIEGARAGGDTGTAIRTNNSVTDIHNLVTSDHYLAFDISAVNGVTGGAPVRRRGALANIFEMYVSLPTPRALTWDEMQEAIKRGTVWQGDAATGGWTNGFNGTYVP